MQINSLRAVELSCLSFCNSFPLFSIACGLFCKKRGGGVPRLFLATRHWLRRRTEKQIPSGRAGICDHTARMRREKGRLQKPKAPATVRSRYIGKAKKPA